MPPSRSRIREALKTSTSRRSSSRSWVGIAAVRLARRRCRWHRRISLSAGGPEARHGRLRLRVAAMADSGPPDSLEDRAPGRQVRPRAPHHLHRRPRKTADLAMGAARAGQARRPRGSTRFTRSQSGDALVQKLEAIAFELSRKKSISPSSTSPDALGRRSTSSASPSGSTTGSRPSTPPS